jgi:serine/threonine protein kinase
VDRDVAIKVLPEAFANTADRLARFQREAKTLASLNHPNIGAIYGLEESGGVSALVMELVEGEDLSQRIAHGAIPVDQALPIAKQIADAREAAHDQGIIHRDLKPANIKIRAGRYGQGARLRAGEGDGALGRDVGERLDVADADNASNDAGQDDSLETP